MNPSFRALRIFYEQGQVHTRLTQMSLDQLTPGEVVIRVHYSSINYKDALAATGRGKILKSFPLNGGIDAAGVVESSTDPRFRVDQEVLVTGCNIGESLDGGYSEYLRAPSDIIVHKPKELNLMECMILGTAGFTAALCLHRMQTNGQQPSMGPVVVTGASGGVGCLAIQLLAQNGYSVLAVSGKQDQFHFLRSLGAQEVLTPVELHLGTRPLESTRFGGAIDNVGGNMLTGLMAHTQLWGNIACVGLAQSAELSTTVMPLILRGVSLLGISSNNTPMPLRQKLWQFLAREWRPRDLARIHTDTVPLSQLASAFDRFFTRQVHGRVIVDVRK